MKRLNISKSILSITSSGTHLTSNHDEHAANMTRQTNEKLSAVCINHPSHFEFFASLPLSFILKFIVEIDHALNKLGTVEFAIMFNANEVYLEDKALNPIFEKLNAREAILFIHPTACNLLVPEGQVQTIKPLEEYSRLMMKFMFDETRAIANLLLSGTISKYLHITFIMSHCGCAIPSIVNRIDAFAMVFKEGENQSDELRKLLRERFFFDLAEFPFPDQIYELLRTLGKGGKQRLIYGSDYSFIPEKVVVDLADQMNEGCKKLFDADQQSAVYSSNAERLIDL